MSDIELITANKSYLILIEIGSISMGTSIITNG